MKTLFFFLAITTAIVNCAWAGNTENTFEGNMLLTASNAKGTPSKITLTIKGDLVLIDARASAAGAPVLLLNSKTGDVHVLAERDSQKIAVRFNTKSLQAFGGIGAVINSYGLDMDGKTKGTVTPTSETKKIAGYNCKKYLVKDAEYESEFWITSELGLSLPALLGNVTPDNNLPAGMILEGKGKKINGEGAFSFKIEPTKASVDAKQVMVPSSYKVMDVTMLIDQMIKSSSPEQVKKMLDQMIPKG